MAALLDRGSVLDELKLGSSTGQVNVYAKFVRKIIERTILPRKILIQSIKTDCEIIAYQGKVVFYRKFDTKNPTWVVYPLSVSEVKALEALELYAGDALKEGKISLSLLNEIELRELKSSGDSNETPDDDRVQETSGVVSLNGWIKRKRGKAQKMGSADPSALEEFAESIREFARFMYFSDGTGGAALKHGSSELLDKNLLEDARPSFAAWSEASSKTLSNGPKLILARSHSGSSYLQFFATDDQQYLVAEATANKFGVISGLWKKVAQT